MLRIVYDASARVADGPSLNDCMHKGAKFNQLIFDVLLRFRTFQYTLMADLEKAFLHVLVEQGDRDVLHFLCVNDVEKETPEICALRFMRVVLGVSASPFLLNAMLKYHLEQYASRYPDTICRPFESTYVDDLVTGSDTEDGAFKLYSQSKRIFCEGGFNLCKFASNSKQLQRRIEVAEQDTSNTSLLEEQKVLGVC